MSNPQVRYHPLTTVAFIGAFFLFMLPGQSDLLYGALRANKFFLAALIVFISTAVVLAPLIYAQIQTRRNPERWKPRLLTKVIWGFVIANIIFDCWAFVNFAYFSYPPPGDKHSDVRKEIFQILKATQIYAMKHNGQFPDTLDALIQGTDDKPPLLDKFYLIDPWGAPYGYTKCGKQIRISSAGPDRNAGTEDDISN
jgi:Type II secretion system (T2SS), protein G